MLLLSLLCLCPTFADADVVKTQGRDLLQFLVVHFYSEFAKIFSYFTLSRAKRGPKEGIINNAPLETNIEILVEPFFKGKWKRNGIKLLFIIT